jgi:hypothetical protein
MRRPVDPDDIVAVILAAAAVAVAAYLLLGVH